VGKLWHQVSTPHFNLEYADLDAVVACAAAGKIPPPGWTESGDRAIDLSRASRTKQGKIFGRHCLEITDESQMLAAFILLGYRFRFIHFMKMDLEPIGDSHYRRIIRNLLICMRTLQELRSRIRLPGIMVNLLQPKRLLGLSRRRTG
jgi:hypothetical protein